MKKYLLSLTLIILLLSISACGGSQADQVANPESASLTPTTDSAEIEPYMPTGGSFLAIYEIGLGPEGYVALTNFTSVPVTTRGQYLCQGSDCFALPDVVIDAGATGKVTVGNGEGLEGVIATKATIGELNPSDGEVALFVSENYDDPKALLNYLQWGSTPHALTKLAVDAGLWIETGYAPTSRRAIRLYRDEKSGWWSFEEAKP